MLKHFLSCKDVKLCVKYWIYIAGPLNTLLWGSESWNISDANCNRLCSFHHSAIRRILGIWMDKVLECQITNKQVRMWFENIPSINELITSNLDIPGENSQNEKRLSSKENVRSLGSNSIQIQKTPITPQRKFHPSPQVSTQGKHIWWCNVQRRGSWWQKMKKINTHFENLSNQN